jgi:hypothetical protein
LYHQIGIAFHQFEEALHDGLPKRASPRSRWNPRWSGWSRRGKIQEAGRQIFKPAVAQRPHRDHSISVDRSSGTGTVRGSNRSAVNAWRYCASPNSMTSFGNGFTCGKIREPARP